MGTSFGWMTSAVPIMEDDQYAFRVTSENFSWMLLLMPLGALLSCLIMVFLVDKFGRKTLMILMGVPTMVGWTLIICARSVRAKTHIPYGSFRNYSTRYRGSMPAEFYSDSLAVHFPLSYPYTPPKLPKRKDVVPWARTSTCTLPRDFYCHFSWEYT